MNGDAAMIPVGLALAVLVGLLVGIANFGLIRLLRIPPIIATLSSSLIILSIAIVVESRAPDQRHPTPWATSTATNIWGVPVLAMLVIAVAAVMHVVLSRTDIRPVGHGHRPEPACRDAGRREVGAGALHQLRDPARSSRRWQGSCWPRSRAVRR